MFPLCLSSPMNGAAFPSPTAEIAEINRIHYELEYTEGISQRMRIPEKLKVASSASGNEEGVFCEAPHSALMQVPERIVVAGTLMVLPHSASFSCLYIFSITVTAPYSSFALHRWWGLTVFQTKRPGPYSVHTPGFTGTENTTPGPHTEWSPIGLSRDGADCGSSYAGGGGEHE